MNSQEQYKGAIRSFDVIYDFISSAPGAVLFSLGKSKVLCTVSLQKGVPLFLRKGGTGWLTAEYAMLPHATSQRTQRESSSAQRSGRAVEISRLIGRVLRTVVDTTPLGENTIYVDCDVLEADGGTRSAAITGASIALERAQRIWLKEGIIRHAFLKDRVASVSIGVSDTAVILDPTYAQEHLLNADFNIIMTATGKLIECHGGAEKAPIDWQQFEKMRAAAVEGVKPFFQKMEADHGPFSSSEQPVFNKDVQKKKKIENLDSAPSEQKHIKGPLFSLANRLAHMSTKQE